MSRFNTDHNADDILNVMDLGDAYTAPELSEQTGIPRRTVLKYLNDLADEGQVARKKTGHRTVIWMRTE